jgi:GT2 family glycosyltransferase
MPDTPLSPVSIVVLTYNRAAELAHTLEKLEALPERPGIIVVDNASSDGTALMVRARFPRCRLVNAPSNMGAAGRNLGVAAVRTPYVAFCDDDTWWAAGALHHAARIFESHPRVAVINASVRVGPSCGADPTCELMSRSPLPAAGLPGPALVGFMAGAAVFRVDAFRRAGGYEPRLFIGGEETLLALDILASGGAIVYVEELTLFHHPSPLRESARRRWLLARNAAWVAWMRLPLGEAVRATLRAARAAEREGHGSRRELLGGVLWALRRRRPSPAEVLEMRRACAMQASQA